MLNIRRCYCLLLLLPSLCFAKSGNATGVEKQSLNTVPPPLHHSNFLGVPFLKNHELYSNKSLRVGLGAQQIRNNISKYGAIWQSQDIVWANKKAWSAFRKSYPEKLCFRYVGSLSARPRASFKQVFELDYIEKNHPEWFLVRDAEDPAKSNPRIPDNRIRWVPYNKKSHNYNRFYLDVCNSELQDYAVQRILEFVSGKAENAGQPYSGIAFDNVVLRRIKVRFNKPYPKWKYAKDLERWKCGYLRYIQKVRKALNSKGYLLVANMSFYYELMRNADDHLDLLNHVDGLMHEWAIGYGTDATGEKNRHWGGKKWLLLINRHEEVLKRGLIDWWASYPVGDNDVSSYNQFLYSYCSFLLVKESGYSLFWAAPDRGTARNSKVPWYNEYDLPIGEATSKRYLRNNCWWRNYENAKVVVNPTSKTQIAMIDHKELWLDWSSKTAVSSINLPPRSARILLPTTYSDESEIEADKVN